MARPARRRRPPLETKIAKCWNGAWPTVVELPRSATALTQSSCPAGGPPSGQPGAALAPAVVRVAPAIVTDEQGRCAMARTASGPARATLRPSTGHVWLAAKSSLSLAGQRRLAPVWTHTSEVTEGGQAACLLELSS